MDDIMFWTGIVLTGGALAAGGIYFLVFALRGKRLSAQLNSEYGEKKSSANRK